jgi:hypothetical protein
MLVARLLAASPVAGDQITLTNGASPQDDAALLGSMRFQLVRRERKWHKRTAAHWGPALALTFSRPKPGAEPLILKEKLQLEENNASRPQHLKVRFNRLSG